MSEADAPYAVLTTSNINHPVLLADAGQARTAAAIESKPITREEVLNWSQEGIRDEVIINRIESSEAVFHLSTSDELRLRDAGVSADVIRRMKATACN